MIDLDESKRLVAIYSARVMRRLVAAGAPAHLHEDVQQECWIAWCKARDAFDPQRGIPFGAFLFNGMKQHLNGWARKHVDRRHQEVIALSLDAKLSDDPDAAELGQVIPSDDPTPDETVERESEWMAGMERLGPKARMFMTLLKEQPKELLDEVKKVQARTEHGRNLGQSAFCFSHLTSALVFQAMGLSRHERSGVMREIKRTFGDMF